MESPPPHLPAPRAVLTALLNTLAVQRPPSPEVPPPAAGRDVARPGGKTNTHHHQPSPASNPLARLPPQARPLLTTLHVLYPALLLPALDLLDRGLVTRVLVDDDEAVVAAPPASSPPFPRPPAACGASEEGEDVDQQEEADQARRDAAAGTFHLVRSAQAGSRRGRREAAGATAGGSTYVVRTAAWNCDCAAFAYRAFPPPSHSSTSTTAATMSATRTAGAYRIGPAKTWGYDDETGGMATGPGQKWEFGGLSLDDDGDGGGTGSPPCCKHLLACVLAERWGSVLGGYVGERRVGRVEAAGLIGGL
ncbi:uncharacterized protein JN550_007695 [Neoarthrinium moseri]|uniref:uncharacterized protein n=1 Tax=Neoarthrinium moseri TaxID=1658444 RepID=UPI001FDDBD5A|nr:uncharacterized protein JN550_007695 [Neoarthrinium moseri]KAI1866307.1 hypothetical protein JN550_007695 [Neoarthrinium moseri]